jgi:transcriptional regulator with XRE-family HTH domain
VKNAAKTKGDPGGKISFIPSAASERMGANIKALRKGKTGGNGKTLSQAEMARHICKKEGKGPYISRIESGKENVTLSRIIEIAEYLGLGENVYKLFLPP